MIQKYLILVDENPQKDTLKKIKDILRNDGVDLIYSEFNPTNYSIRDSSGDLDFDVDKCIIFSSEICVDKAKEALSLNEKGIMNYPTPVNAIESKKQIVSIFFIVMIVLLVKAIEHLGLRMRLFCRMNL